VSGGLLLSTLALTNPHKYVISKGASASFFMFDLKPRTMICLVLSGNNPVNLTDPADDM
jgi:hypothetical protein